MKKIAVKNKVKQQAIVDEFNAKAPVGTSVRYWTGVREGPGRMSTTRSKAEVLSEHTAVVWVAGQSGCISLTHVEIVSGAEISANQS